MAAVVAACITDPVKACITEPAKAVGKWIGEQIFQQITFLWCFTSIITGLKEELQKLKDDTEKLKREVRTGKDNSQEPVPQVTTWLTNSDKLIVKIDGILNEAEKVGGGASELGARLSLSKRAKETTEHTEKHRAEKPEIEFLPRPNAAMQGVPLGKTFECESRNKMEEEIMEALKGGDKIMMGICGMGGVGKTTMAKKLMNGALEKGVFKEVVIVTFSQKVNDSNIQDEIGDQLGLKKLKEETLQSARARLLRTRLSDEKTTTLLVLDDVWQKPPLERIGIPCDSKWCKIIFTSRNADVLHKMGVQIFGMETLFKKEAWSFFRERAGPCVDDPDLNPLAKQIAKECGGLPINLAAVGAVLKYKPIRRIWNRTLRKLKENVPDNVQYGKSYNPLKLSYEYLESKEAQSIFLLCCLFPEDADIPLDYLTYFCMGLGGIFEEDITNMEDAMDKMCELTEKLKDRSLLLKSDKEDCVRMHDVIRDVCTSIAKDEGYIGKGGCTWISSSHFAGETKELLSESRCSNLRLLFSNDSSGFDIHDAFTNAMIELHVLYIARYSLTTLPHQMQSLENLNTLILDTCWELETISVVARLVNLRTLICRNCSLITELPSEMKELNHLKVLDLTGCKNLQRIGRDIIKSLVGLEELKILDSFDKWEAEEREERENASIKELEALPNLACLEIEISDSSSLAENMPLLSKKIDRFIIRSVVYSDFPSKFSRAMSLGLERETRLGDWIEKQLLKDTECLCLSGDGASNVELAKIHQNIRWLGLGECESMKNVVTSTVFPSIEYLELYNLPELQGIWDGPISSNSFRNLKELDNVPHFSNLSSIIIGKCDSLRNLGQLSMAGKDCLPQLEKLSIEKCEMMEQVFLWNHEEARKNETSIESQGKRHVLFTKLKEVELYELPNLTIFYQGIQRIEFPLLREMKIKGCPEMKSIIGRCSPDIDDDASSHHLCQPQNVSFGSLEVIEINQNPFCGNKIPSSIFTNGLKELSITKCGGRMSLFTFSMAANLVSLRDLRIINCREMIKVIEDEQEEQRERILVFPKLEILKLKYLPNLVTFCDSKCKIEFPILWNVEIERCPSMTNIGMGLVATPNLEAFTTNLTTYVGVGVGDGVAFNGLKELDIIQNVNPFYDHIISVSLFNRLETLIFVEFKGGSMSVFSSAATGELVNLRVLQIRECKWILVSVSEEREETEDGKLVSGGEMRTLLFPKLEELYLYYLPNLVSFCEWKCDVELPSLTKVIIEKCPNMESFSMGFAAAPNLKIVSIDYGEIDATKDLHVAVHQHYLAQKVSINLEIDYNPFYGHKILSSIFNRLEELTIYRYDGSMSLFTLSMAANLVTLRVLCIRDCGEMIKVIEDGAHQERILVFPKLDDLDLSILPKLVSFCDSKCEIELPSLKKVVITECPNMESFSMGLVATPNLEAFSTDISTYVGIGVNVAFNSLKTLMITKDENPFDHHKFSISHFNGLESLIFYRFKGSVSLFSCSAVGSLCNLKVFGIEKCDEIVTVMEDDEEKKLVSGGEVRNVVFPKLEELYLGWLPNLVRFCEWKCDVEFPSLTKVEINYCSNIESFSMGFVAAPNLKTVEIDGHEEIDATKDLNGLLQQHYLAHQ